MKQVSRRIVVVLEKYNLGHTRVYDVTSGIIQYLHFVPVLAYSGNGKCSKNPLFFSHGSRGEDSAS